MRRDQNPKRFSGLFMRILLSYTTILAVAIVMNVFFYSLAYRRVEENTLESRRLLLSQTADSLSRLISDVISDGKQILATAQVNSLLYCREEDFTVYKKLSVMRLQEELTRRIAYNDSIDSILVLFTRSGISASNAGIRREDALSAELSERFGLTTARLNEASTGHLPFTYDSESGRFTAFCYDSVIRSRPDAICLMAVSTTAVHTILESGADEDGVALWLLSPDGQAIAASSRILPKEALSRLAEETDFSADLHGVSCRFLRTDLSVGGWRLAVAVDMEHFKQPLRRLQEVYISVTLAALVLGALLAVFFSRRRANRIAQITRLFIDRSGAARDELSALEEGMQRLLDENSQYRENIASHLGEIRENWIIRVLHKKIGSEESFRQGCLDYQTGFTSDVFTLVCLEAVAYTGISEAAGDTAEDIYDLVNYSLDAFAGEFLSRRYNSLRCFYNNCFYYILNPKELPEVSLTADEEREELRRICLSLISYARERVGVSLRCYISGTVSGATGLASAYEETREGMARIEAYGISDALNDRESVEATLTAIQSQKDQEKTVSVQVDAIRRSIDARFRDPMLSVSLIADDFHISQSYLLRLFKKELGVGVLEYISQQRVEEAKQLLKETKDTVSVIAEKVGYTNSLALIRAFRKQENLTPTEYRHLF